MSDSEDPMTTTTLAAKQGKTRSAPTVTPHESGAQTDRPQQDSQPKMRPSRPRPRTMRERRTEVTRILRQGGEARNDLLPLIYDELRAIAQNRMHGERSGHTLQATALVHEAYLKLVGEEQVAWRDRGHFYAAAAEAMRRVLIDHARRINSLKRGGDRQRVTLGGPDIEAELDVEQLLALNDALDLLAKEDERAAAVARLRFLSGLSVDETAQALGISERSVHREWTYARARLFELLGDG